MPLPDAKEWSQKFINEIGLDGTRTIADFLREFQSETLYGAAEIAQKTEREYRSFEKIARKNNENSVPFDCGAIGCRRVLKALRSAATAIRKER